MKLQILIPQYKETEDIIRPLLDSIQIQQNVNLKEDVGVIIVNDGSNIKLSRSFLDKYTFSIIYYENEHKGVSATRNKCLDLATADYVMFCDADDMFFNACGLYIIFREIYNGGFDSLISAFIEETRDFETQNPIYINHATDSVFVHGKVHNRKFLLDNNIRWNDSLTIHEDSYFNCLCQKLAKQLKYSPTSFYLWRWRDDSVCRHDPKYILKTFNNMLDSSEALIDNLLSRGLESDGAYFAATMIYDSYFTMNKQEWLNQENQEYRSATEKRFKEFYEKFQELFDNMSKPVKSQIVMGIKNQKFEEGLLFEKITFDDWINHIKAL